jgi:phenylacetate-CoA ligase
LSDIKKIPCISKSDLLNNANQIQNIKGYRKLFLSETSGSTGQPLIFYRNSEWDSGTRAAQLRGYSWYDVNPWELNGYFWGYSFDSKKKMVTKLQDVLLNRFRLFSYDKEDVKEFANKLIKATYLEGYSSMIYEVAKVINKEKFGPYNLNW